MVRRHFLTGNIASGVLNKAAIAPVMTAKATRAICLMPLEVSFSTSKKIFELRFAHLLLSFGFMGRMIFQHIANLCSTEKFHEKIPCVRLAGLLRRSRRACGTCRTCCPSCTRRASRSGRTCGAGNLREKISLFCGRENIAFRFGKFIMDFDLARSSVFVFISYNDLVDQK